MVSGPTPSACAAMLMQSMRIAAAASVAMPRSRYARNSVVALCMVVLLRPPLLWGNGYLPTLYSLSQSGATCSDSFWASAMICAKHKMCDAERIASLMRMLDDGSARWKRQPAAARRASAEMAGGSHDPPRRGHERSDRPPLRARRAAAPARASVLVSVIRRRHGNGLAFLRHHHQRDRRAKARARAAGEGAWDSRL